MTFAKLLNRNEQIAECLKRLQLGADSSLMTTLSKPYHDLIAAQERVLNAAEQLADSLRRAG